MNKVCLILLIIISCLLIIAIVINIFLIQHIQITTLKLNKLNTEFIEIKTMYDKQKNVVSNIDDTIRLYQIFATKVADGISLKSPKRIVDALNELQKALNKGGLK